MPADDELDLIARDESFSRALGQACLIAVAALLVGFGYLLWAGAGLLAGVAALFALASSWLAWRCRNGSRQAVPEAMVVAVAYTCAASVALGRDGLGFLPLLPLLAAVLFAPSLSRATRMEVVAVLLALLLLLPVLAGGAQLQLDFSVLPQWLHITASGLGLALLAIAAADQLARQEQRIAQLGDNIDDLARTDRLTSLPTRAFLEQQLIAEVARAQRSKEPLCLALFDIDGMSLINERHGHSVGDAVLRVAASTLQKALRHYDHIGRWEGQQFLLVMPCTSLVAACTVCDRLRALVENASRVQSGVVPPFTASFGIAELRPQTPPEDTVTKARAALELAQRSGPGKLGHHTDGGPVLLERGTAEG